MTSWRSVCLLLLALCSSIEPGTSQSSQSSGGWQSPTGCSPPNCDYSCFWNLDPATDMLLFNVTGKQGPGTWVAVAFSATTKMENQDTIYGYVDDDGDGYVVDGWVSTHYSPPVADTVNNLASPSISYINGVYYMTFKRPRLSADSQDVSFTPTAAYYFKYPVGGGQMQGSSIQMHTNIPIISSSTITIAAPSAASSTSMASAGSTVSAKPTSPKTNSASTTASFVTLLFLSFCSGFLLANRNSSY